MTALEEIKKALEGVGPLKVEFTPDCDEFNAIIAPINDDYDGTFFTVIGCGDKQDKIGGFMAVAVNTVQELVDTIESLQRENDKLRRFLFPYADRTDISGISWDGKYLIGDKASIGAFHEMKNRGEQIDVYKRAYDQKEAALKARSEAAEAEVRRLRDLLRFSHDTLQEINPSNYDHDDVCKMNDASVEVILAIAPELGETHGKSKEWWDERQALASTGGLS